MNDKLKAHRVIGIRHALSVLKEDGLISKGINYPKDASDEMIQLLINTALEFYELGAKQGAEKTIDHFISEKFTTQKRNGQRSITANVSSVNWQHTFPVKAGITEDKIIKKVRIPISDLGFE
ncbi:hypothetical protein HGP28_09865 [Vibrio sp. SM6]|uniref:Uncharacterized protein n=1 Tax=Vibrio agarilyticus TaxID=2726741 RepID=A0A7X8YH86_9VIBR|nr:hypothetical protein [Vibrio agarilyticus]NLS13196.1 hypothetical protein [Vibrio agarilyticus]